MRIVSQDKCCDINYDNVQIMYQELDGSEEYLGCRHAVTAVLSFFEQGDKWCILGSYESKERCLEVMERIRSSYFKGSRIYFIPE